MIKVLMVCLGNICRSPLAEGILKSKIDSHKIYVDSAGTGGWHVGELPDKRSIEVARHHRVDLTKQRCRKFTISDFDKFNFIYVMDKSNYKNVIALARNEEDKSKVHYILSITKSHEILEVPDPYYDGNDGFEDVYQMLNEACDFIADKLNDNE